MKQITLEKFRFGMKIYLSEEILDDLDIDIDYISNEVSLLVRGFIWAEQENIKHQEIKYPLDWIQAFKERWFPKFLLRFYPIKYKHIIIDVKAIYPEFRPKLPEHHSRLVITKAEDLNFMRLKDET